CRGGVAKAPARNGFALADLHRVAAEAVHHLESGLVGNVVAEEDRDAAREGRLGHELADGASLVDARGLELVHHLAGLDLERAARATRRLFDHGPRRRLELR